MKELELYVNYKFNIIKLMKMMFKKSEWGKKYTLFDTGHIEVICNMVSYNFDRECANMKISVNEKDGEGFAYDEISIYNYREDYTPKFIKNLMYKKIISLCLAGRRSLADSEASEKFQYKWYSEKNREFWLSWYGDDEEVEEVINAQISEKAKDKVLDKMADDGHDRYNQINYTNPKNDFITNLLANDSFKPKFLELAKIVKEKIEEQENE